MAPLFYSPIELDNILNGTPPPAAFIAYKVDFAFLIQSALTGFKKHCIMWWKLSGVFHPCTDQQPEINPYVSRNWTTNYSTRSFFKTPMGQELHGLSAFTVHFYHHLGIQEPGTLCFVSDDDEDRRNTDDVTVNRGLRGRMNVNILFFFLFSFAFEMWSSIFIWHIHIVITFPTWPPCVCRFKHSHCLTHQWG